MTSFLDLELTAEYVRSRFNYDPETGAITWRVPPKCHGHRAGKPAGRNVRIKNSKVLSIVKLHGKYYQQSRIAWLHHYGVHADKYIDHIDGNRTNQAISNLRLATHAENMLNIVRNNPRKSLPQGVSQIRKTGRFFARSMMGGKSTYIGTFDTPEEASAAYKQFINIQRAEFSPSHRLA